MLSPDTLSKFEDEIRKTIPKFRVSFKDQSILQKVIGFFSWPFNPGYMTKYSTTLGSTVYFPSRSVYESDPDQSFEVLAHEFVHLSDSHTSRVRFGAAYAMPQLLSLVGILLYLIFGNASSWPLLVLVPGLPLCLLLARWSKVAFGVGLGLVVCLTGVLAGVFTGWPSYFLLESLILLAPWPSPWRVRSELRGYTMSLAVAQWRSGSLGSSALSDLMRQNFTGSPYYFMSWSQREVDSGILNVLSQVSQGMTQQEAPYSLVYGFMKSNGMLSA